MKDQKHAAKYNDWCCKLGRTASKAVGECKTRNLKETVPWYEKYK